MSIEVHILELMLNIKDKKNMKKLYLENGYTYKAIGDLYGVSRQRVHSIITGYKSFSSSGMSFANLPGLNISICRKCSGVAKYVHHVDRNSSNNRMSNLMPLCVPCHKFIHKGEKRGRFKEELL
jgi:hypothetical protein